MKQAKNLIITFIVLFFSAQLQAQYELEKPDRALVDQGRLEQCKREVDKINSMQLKCDTVMNISIPSELYFDKQGRLRKSSYSYRWESEGGTGAAYYDENGSLVYIENAGGTNCDDGKEYFYIHDGRIVDFGFYYGCGCCEEYEQEAIDAKRPIVGSLYADTREYGKNSISTENVFYTFVSGTVDRLGGYFNLLPKSPKTIPKVKASDIRYYESLQSLPPYFMRDSINNPKAYILQYFGDAKTVIAIEKENKYLVFSIIPPSGYNEYEIVRENLDGIGSNELIIRLKYSEKLEYTDYETNEKLGYSTRQSGIMVWNLDTYDCLLNVDLSGEFIHWGYSSSGEKLVKESTCYGYEIDLGNKQLAIQKFISRYNVDLSDKQLSARKIKGCEGCEEVMLEQKHIYKLAELGFVLDKVDGAVE